MKQRELPTLRFCSPFIYFGLLLWFFGSFNFSFAQFTNQIPTSIPEPNWVFQQPNFQPPPNFRMQALGTEPNAVVPVDFQLKPADPLPDSTIFLPKLENPNSVDTRDAAKPDAVSPEKRVTLKEEEKAGPSEEKRIDEDKKKDDGLKLDSDKKKEKKWYEKINFRGYTQIRYNEVLSREDGSAPPQHVSDRSVSEDQTFSIRRARIILSGDISDHMSIYLQPDFASTPNGSVDAIQFAQIRDWYADCFWDKSKIHRFRVGQSKIPYGWENMQSSSNRLPLDRNDALNSAARNERDLGIFYYWTPEPAQDFFTEIQEKGLKGSGNYGVFAFGAYNGQGGSLAEQGDHLHWISRFTLPMELDNGQFAELGIQAYTGRYAVGGSAIRPLGIGAAATPLGTIEQGNRRGISDERVAWTGVWYPQPLGFQTEWTVGRGPALNAAQTALEERALYGGYAMTMYRHETQCHGILFPFMRWNYFKGGYKSERNAPFSLIEELEAGLEWQMNKQMELVAMYTLTDRTNTTAFNQSGVRSYQQFNGDLLRFQFQFNY